MMVDPMANGQSVERATSQVAFQVRVQIRKESRPRRSFRSSLLRVPHDLRKCKTVKPLATIHVASQASRRIINRFGIHFTWLQASKTNPFLSRGQKRNCAPVCREKFADLSRVMSQTPTRRHATEFGGMAVIIDDLIGVDWNGVTANTCERVGIENSLVMGV